MMQIVRELAAERNSVAKIAFLTRLPEAAVREALGLAAAAGAEVRGACNHRCTQHHQRWHLHPAGWEAGSSMPGHQPPASVGWVIPPRTPCRMLAASGARAAGVRALAPGSTGKGRS